MESSSEVERSSHAIVIQPNETVLTALPYGPQTSLLDFLKGEPKVLGAIQILLALITVGVGTIFAFNYFSFSQRFPLIFFTGYPFWGAFIFLITGYITGINEKKRCMGLGVTGMNVISSLVAVAGITLTIISYRQQHEYCQMPSLEGICVIGRILFNGILSILLITSIVELGISVTIASFRSKCWTTSDEIVFFLSSDLTQESELSISEENAAVQFELQEQSTTDSTTNMQPVFIGGYTFFKLRITRNPLAFRHSRRRSSNTYYVSSVSMPDEQQKSIRVPLKLYDERPRLKSLPPPLQEMLSEEIPYTKPLNEEDLQFATAQHPEQPTQLLQSQALPLQVLPSNSIKKLQVLPPQALPVLASQPPSSYQTESHGLISEDMAYHDITSQESQYQKMPSQDIQSQDTPSSYAPSQVIPSQNALSQDMQSPVYEDILYQDVHSQPRALPAQPKLLELPAFHAGQSSNMQCLQQQALDLQHRNQKLEHVSYQDMHSEVKLLTQEWKSKEQFHSKKSSEWQFLNWQNKNVQSLKLHDLDWQNKGWQTPKHKSQDLQKQGQKPLKKKSLDQHVKDWLSPKRHSIDKQTQVKQTRKKSSDLQANNQLLVSEGQSLRQQSPSRQYKYQQDKKEKSPKEQPKDRQDKAQQTDMEQPPKKQTQHEQAEDLQVREKKSPKEQPKDRKDKAQQTDMEKSPKKQPQYEEAENLQAQEEKSLQLHQNWQSQVQEYQAWQSSHQQSQDWRSQGWRNKEWKAQDVQFETPHSLKWESQVWQTQDLLEKESLKQKTLHQEGQHVHVITRRQQLQSIPLEDSQSQDEKQQDLKSTDIQNEDMQTETMQIRDSKPESMKYPNLYRQQSEDKKPDFCCSCQSSIQDTHFAYISDVNSEQDVQKNISMCSISYQEDMTLTSPSCSPKDQQQSEDSD
ncbi:membrane-spanning 4-domains subfamily A member 14 [Suricata suricatta]|uniref:Membrane spanning 4-domains A14 n=1 Tax=Suricata suricatta TaxID=37032 RepID=A0A673U744_SURSU|nr:membrane-spanning 4-domains subfamily A member 14 [Suricata suricatta]XP_029811849.1 membrane-spanning 4-domains subfamily A member 14 [Suricata suricatta]